MLLRENTLTFFLYNCLWSLLGITQDFQLCNVVPIVLKQHSTVPIPVQFCLESLRQHCTRILPVECRPKSITTILNKIFSCAMLSEASWTTLNNILLVQYSTESIQTTFNRNFFCKMLSEASWTTLHKDFTCAMLCQRALRQN